MKFSELQVGQRFTCANYESGTIDVKIVPKNVGGGLVVNVRDPRTGIEFRLSDITDVIPVNKKGQPVR